MMWVTAYFLKIYFGTEDKKKIIIIIIIISTAFLELINTQ